MRDRMAQTILHRVTRNEAIDCAFCADTMRHGEKIVQFACFPDHQFHKSCYDEFVEYFEKQGTPLLCPLCRAEVDKDKVVEKKIEQQQDET